MQEVKTKTVSAPPVSWLSPIEWEAIEKYIKRVSVRYGDKISRMILFGSRVRGEGNEDSDIDVAVIIMAENRHIRRELLDLSTEIWLETEIKISPLIFSTEEFQTLSQMERGIIVAIHREGVELL